MLSLSTFDVFAAVLFVGGCVILFCVRYVPRGPKQPTHNRKEPDE